MQRGAASVASDVRRAIAAAARNIRHVARRQVPRGWTTRPVAGVTIEQRVDAARARRLLRAGRTLSAALVAPDDGDPRAGRRRARDHRGLPEAGPDRHGRRARGGRDAAPAARRRARDRRAGVRHRDHPARRQDRRARQRLRRRREGARRGRLRHRLLRRAQRDPRRLDERAGRRGSRPTSSRRPSTTRTRGRSS